jgi:hypothetical protein
MRQWKIPLHSHCTWSALPLLREEFKHKGHTVPAANTGGTNGTRRQRDTKRKIVVFVFLGEGSFVLLRVLSGKNGFSG